MSGSALGISQFGRARLDIELGLNQLAQMFGGARQHRMAEGVQARFVSGDSTQGLRSLGPNIRVLVFQRLEQRGFRLRRRCAK